MNTLVLHAFIILLNYKSGLLWCHFFHALFVKDRVRAWVAFGFSVRLVARLGVRYSVRFRIEDRNLSNAINGLMSSSSCSMCHTIVSSVLWSCHFAVFSSYRNISMFEKTILVVFSSFSDFIYPKLFYFTVLEKIQLLYKVCHPRALVSMSSR